MAENATPRIHGIILAGAYPDGQCALDRLIPRPLLPVAQQPLITYALRWMRSGGLHRATICTNSAARAIRTHLGPAAFDMGLDYLEDWSPRGPAGCVGDAGARTDADTFVVADGTAVPVVDIQELLEAHRASDAAITVVVGADSAGRLRPTGVYVFDRWAFHFIPEEGFQDIKEKLIPRLYAAGETVSTQMAQAVAPRVVNADTYLALNQWAIERAAHQVGSSDGFQVSGEAIVHESAVVLPSARLLGPVLVGPRATVQPGATLVGPVSIGPGTSVGRGAVISRSVLWSGCVVGEGAFVDRCMLADGARIEPRKSVFSAVKTAGREEGSHERGARRPGKTLWNPLAAVIRPTAHHQL